MHPVLIEACVDFAARAMKELWPVGGPVKDSIEGRLTGKRLQKANRKTALMNWQLTKQCRDFRAELEQTMTQVPLGGTQYTKLSWNLRRNRPMPLFVAIDDLILPYAATNFYSAQRKTHVEYLTQLEFNQRVSDGLYRDLELSVASLDLDQTEAGAVSDRIEGREQSPYNEDGLRKVYECHAIVEIEGVEDEPSPFIISIDNATKKILSIYRNWDEDDESREELTWFVEWPFVPWRGAYALGLPHMIGGLSGAATGALRALLDSAHISNAQSGLKLKGSKISGQNKQPRPGEIATLEGGVAIDDIRKLYMPTPTNQPSPVLFELLGFLVDAAKSVVRTSVEDITDPGANAPVGTTMARIEQGLVVYSSIHGRLHDAMDRMLDILHRLNAKYLDDEKVEADVGTELAKREDFQGPRDVAPVSDPNIYSDAQRYAQVQAISQRAALLPQLYNLRKVEERLLRTLKVADPDELLNPDLQPKEQNAVVENVTAALGRPVTAFPEQDHVSHLRTHLPFMLDPMYGGNPVIQPQLLPVMVGHIKEHLLWAYASYVFDECNDAIGQDVGDFLRELVEEQDKEGLKKMDALLTEANMLALQKAKGELGSTLQVLQQAQQVLQQMQQAQQQNMAAMAAQDPRIAAQMNKDNNAHQLGMAKLQQDGQKTQLGAQSEAQKLQVQQVLAAQHEQHEDQRAQLKVQAELAKNEEDNATAMQIASAEIASGHKSALSTGSSLGEGQP